MYGNSKLFQTERRYDEPIDGIELQPSSGSRQLGSTRDVRRARESFQSHGI